MTPLVVADTARAARIRIMHAAGGALADPRLLRAVQEFLAASEASREAASRARLVDAGGWGGFDDEAETLFGEAADAWKTVASGWAAGMFVSAEVLDAGSPYAAAEQQRLARRTASRAIPEVGAWSGQSGQINWSLGRAA